MQMSGLMDNERPEGFRIVTGCLRLVMCCISQEKGDYHGKRKEISTGHYVYG